MNSDIITLPSLEGTEKQVKWADDIRREALSEMERLLATLRSRPNTEKWMIDAYLTLIQEIFDDSAKCAASWWIDRRAGRPGEHARWESDLEEELSEEIARVRKDHHVQVPSHR